jgi:CarD family transcriptional regulator
MFNVGDKVVYPLHGAGQIESIEEHEVLGKIQKYYVVRLLVGGMKVMVPVNSSDGQVRLRKIIGEDEVKKVITILKNATIKPISDWKVRYNTNLEKMKTGCIYKVAEVARSLAQRNKEKGLSSGERRLLETACTAITSELAFAQDIDLEQATMMVDNILARN